MDFRDALVVSETIILNSLVPEVSPFLDFLAVPVISEEEIEDGDTTLWKVADALTPKRPLAVNVTTALFRSEVGVRVQTPSPRFGVPHFAVVPSTFIERPCCSDVWGPHKPESTSDVQFTLVPLP